MAQLNYKTLRQEVADEIRRKILKGEFKAGERIKEHEMAQLLGVSRGPVREALRQLEQEGLVRYERNVGCSVAPINEKDIYEIGLLRAALEILAVKLCKGKMEPQALQRMRDSVEQMRQAGSDLYHQAQLDNSFHSCIVEQAGFHKLERIWKSMDTSNVAVFAAVENRTSCDACSVTGNCLRPMRRRTRKKSSGHCRNIMMWAQMRMTESRTSGPLTRSFVFLKGPQHRTIRACPDCHFYDDE